MPENLGRIWVMLFLLPWLVAGSGLAQAANPDEELAGLRERIAALQAEMQRMEGRRRSETMALARVERRIGVLSRSLRDTQRSLRESRQRLAELRSEQQRLESGLRQQQSLLAGQLRAAYVVGRQEKLRLLLKQQDPAVMARVFTYHDYFNRERGRLLRGIGERLQHLAQTRQAVLAEEQAAGKLRKTLASERQAQQRLAAERQQVVARLAARMRSTEAKLAVLQADAARLEQLLDDIRQVLDDVSREVSGRSSFRDSKGKLPWPARGRLLARFGSTRIGSLRWEGVLIGAPEGSPVRVVHRGRVAYADWLRGFGLLLIVDHGEGYMSLYGYNQSLYKELGDWVEAGESVASVGRSGGRDSAAVYFAIRRQGRSVNPEKWCRGSRGLEVGWE